MTNVNRGQENNPESPIQFSGKVPPQFLQALKQVREEKKEADITVGKDPYADLPVEESVETPPPPQKKQPQYIPKQQKAPRQPKTIAGSPQLKDLLDNLMERGVIYDEIVLPSKGAFYNGTDGPANGVLHIRAMTGEEEQILSTPRYVKRGTAINMIFQRCLKENIKTDNLLTLDRTYMLIWLRGVSYGHEYEVDIKCPECDKKFSHTINLNELMVNYCPDDFTPPLTDILPKSEYNFIWHLPRGMDENKVQEYRDKRMKEFGDNGIDDSIIYRMALMLDEIEGVKDKTELMLLLKKLPTQDVSYLRSLVLDTPFGVDTKCQITCKSCYHDFEVELPLEASFFFPRHKRKKEETSSDSGNI